ncbi:MAG: FAD-dependent oxidoreductase, partial [Bacteroidetes bacterium]
MDAAEDVGSGGQTKANSGVIHAGYDSLPGTARAALAHKGCCMFPGLDRELKFGFRKSGSVVVARSGDDVALLRTLLD